MSPSILTKSSKEPPNDRHQQNEKVHNVIGFKAFAVAGDCDKDGGEFYDPEPLMTVAQHERIVGSLRAENAKLREALQAVEAEVDGNLRPLTRDLVNMVSGLKNGSHPNDIYEHCDEIERIIGAALEGDKP
ncbi:TPA: hypothetical protein ACQQIU_001989 [Pseudomonas aeruginosa]